MRDDDYALETLPRTVAEADLVGLAELLVGAVNAGEALSFLAPLARVEAEAWWRRVFETAPAKATFWVCRSAGEIVGTLQLQPAWAPNQPHRAEILKLIVSAEHRRRGLARRLMQAAEAKASALGYWLLSLDAKQGAAAELLYRELGWVEVGSIPDFALDPDGKTHHAAVIFYRDLRA